MLEWSNTGITSELFCFLDAGEPFGANNQVQGGNIAYPGYRGDVTVLFFDSFIFLNEFRKK